MEKQEQLILEAKSGNKSSLDKLLKVVQPIILSTLNYLNVDFIDSNDILQEVLFKISKKINQLKNIKYFKTWLNQIILNSFYDYLRKNKKDKKIIYYSDNSEPIVHQIPDFNSNPQNSVLNNELDLIIKTSINKLPLHYKIPITLREIQGLSYEEISKITNIAAGTVKSRIARAREKIKNDINKYSKG